MHNAGPTSGCPEPTTPLPMGWSNHFPIFLLFVLILVYTDFRLHELYGKPDIMRIVKSRRLRWAGHATRMGNERGAWKLLVGKPEGNVQ